MTHLLHIACDDEVGLVSKITGALFRHQCNIVNNGEHVDAETGRFFMRTEFQGNPSEKDLLSELESVLPDGSDVRLTRPTAKRIVVMVTKEPHCLGDLLVRCSYDDLNARIQGVIGNHDDLEPLARRFDCPFHLVSHEGKDREKHEEEIGEILDSYSPDVIVLAKYMRVLSAGFIERYRTRIINIHHSFLPAFTGAQPYRQAHDRGVKIIGATAHFASEELDEGPILVQGVIPVNHEFTPREMARAGRDVEKTVLARALRLVLEERVFVSGRKTIVFE